MSWDLFPPLPPPPPMEVFHHQIVKEGKGDSHVTFPVLLHHNVQVIEKKGNIIFLFSVTISCCLLGLRLMILGS